ncbi:MAG TPA: hypothetical protein VNO14_03345 [Blastocatellia bacterium]|nr:hypothetical protein [Blastocatellia bacterium]
MQSRCEACHTTPDTPVMAGFNPEIYAAHEREAIACSTCHKEHRGQDTRSGLISYGVCYQSGVTQNE